MDDNQEVEGFDQENLYFDTVIGCIEDMIISRSTCNFYNFSQQSHELRLIQGNCC